MAIDDHAAQAALLLLVLSLSKGATGSHP
jgi:hypothetical protein